MKSALLVIAPHTNPDAKPPIAAFQGSFFSRSDSAKHSTVAKVADAEPIQNAGREIALMISRGPSTAFAAKRFAAAPPVGGATGSGNHANWTAAKNVPPPAPSNYVVFVLAWYQVKLDEAQIATSMYTEN